MVNAVEVLAVIQARGGSKGLPGKNLRPLLGHPLVAYSVASARASTRVTRTILSTDSVEIARVAAAYGAEVPFMRPAELAADNSPDYPLFQHALRWLWEEERYRPDIVVQIRPTTPLRPRGLIDRAVDLLLANEDADSARTVTPPKQTPFKMWRPSEDGRLIPLLETGSPEPYNSPRQSLPPVLWQTGHLDVFWSRTVIDARSLTGKEVLRVDVDGAYCIDIDTMDDFKAAADALNSSGIDIDRPDEGQTPRSALPDPVELIVFDFDGVFTDNRVVVHEDGQESVVCHRGDGLGISRLKALGIRMLVLSTEVNPVVSARCRKLGLECVQGLDDKLSALRRIASERTINLSRTIYIGNDINDLACLQSVGCAIVPGDAHTSVKSSADIILSSSGGFGAVRELSDMIELHTMGRVT